MSSQLTRGHNLLRFYEPHEEILNSLNRATQRRQSQPTIAVVVDDDEVESEAEKESLVSSKGPFTYDVCAKISGLHFI